MPHLRLNELQFSFPTVHPSASCKISFIRTLRLPDEGVYPLPPHLGKFPVRHVEPQHGSIAERGGVMLPMWQSEALWLAFETTLDVDRRVPYPFAIRIAAGMRSAVTGAPWIAEMREKDYVVLPQQKWLDGFVVSPGKVRQFVAMPLGLGVTAEEQLSGTAEFGGLQIQVFPMIGREYESRFPRPVQRVRGHGELLCSTKGATRGVSLESCLESSSMGIAAGGLMEQQVHADPYGLHVWDQAHTDRVFVHIMNSQAWTSLTGEPPPSHPRSAEEYAHHRLPWFDYYLDGPVLGGTAMTSQIKSLGEIKSSLGEATTGAIVVNPHDVHQVKDGNW